MLGAVGDHPAVSAFAWDVILCGISLGIWAGCRGLDIQAVAYNARVPFVSNADSSTASTTTKSVSKSVSSKASTAVKSVKRSSPARKLASAITRASEEADAATAAAGLRRSGRKRKSTVSPSPEYKHEEEADEEFESSGVGDSSDDEDYQAPKGMEGLGRGEEEEAENFEPAAVTWALFVLGGLGVTGAGVWGAEVAKG